MDLKSGYLHSDAQFTDREKINLEIYAERMNDDAMRDMYLGLARSEASTQEREVAVGLSR